jgi:hypothetical protein
MEEAAMTSTTCESRPGRSAMTLPSPAEVDAMLQAVNVRLIQHDLAPEPLISPEAGWTIAAVAAGAVAGSLGLGLLIGGWTAALAGALAGAAAGGVFAVLLWRASDLGGHTAPRNTPLPDPAADDLLTGW